MHQALYLPSTPLNTLVSVAHAAVNQTCQQSILWLIDQKNTQSNPYYQVLKQAELDLFKDIQCFGGVSKNSQKASSRSELFKQFQYLLENEQVSDVLVGNDRRIEFQFLMHWLSQKSLMPTGHYLDDGLYSYAGKPSVWYKDGVNALLKKWVYGLWWDEPKTVGASHWISDVWVMDTGLIHPLLKSKKRHALSAEIFSNEKVVQFSRVLLAQFDESTEDYQSIDLIALLPHPNNIKKMTGYREKLQRLIQRYVSQGKSIAVKYHPRMEGDGLNLIALGAKKIIPSGLAFEFILPLLKTDVILIGDVGSALFMAKKLRPDINSIAVLDETDAFQRRFLDLFKRAEITIKSHGELFD